MNGEPTGPGTGVDLVLFAHTGEEARLRSLAALAAAAAATGRRVIVVWEGPALARLAAGELDASAALEHGVEAAGPLLSEARRLGTVRYLACPTAVRAAGVTEEVARARVDEVKGLASILDEIEGAGTTLFI